MAKKINLGKVGITLEGNYDSSKSYASRTCVFYNHVSWTSKKDVPAGIAPGSNDEYWQKVSERGAQGERGPQGNSAYINDGEVNKFELVNNLTQGGEAAALSAEQGKILKKELTELESELQSQQNTLYGGSFSKLENNIIGQRTRYITLSVKQGNKIEVYFESSSSLHCMLGVNFSDGTSNGSIVILTNNNPYVYTAEKDVTNILFYIQEAGDIETFAMYVNINNNLPRLYTKVDNNDSTTTLLAAGDIAWEEGYYDYADGSKKSASFYRRTQKFDRRIEDLFTELPFNENDAFISLWKSGVYVGFRQYGNFYSPASKPNESAIVSSIEYDEFAFSVLINNITDYLTKYQFINIKSLSQSLSQSLSNIGFWSGKKIGFLGDSITAGAYFDANGGHETERPYCIACCEELHAIPINYGTSGTSISSTSAISPSSAFVKRYSKMADDLDMIVVLGGTNDFSNGNNVVLGTLDDRTDISFYGAMDVLCKGLLTKYPDKRIVFITPLLRNNSTGSEGITNDRGFTIEQVRQAIVEVAQDRYGLIVINGKSLGISPYSPNKTEYIWDGLHPNPPGYEMMGKNLGHILSAI
jgi:lysophospholipase L1-like esterase